MSQFFDKYFLIPTYLEIGCTGAKVIKGQNNNTPKYYVTCPNFVYAYF